ncbi:MAG: hypothetical protein J1F39_05745 [Clostridiales bacterium]|nr:hypothetical protein [Clostridiales bacterium]
MKKRIPWGFFAGLCGVLGFYLTVAIVVVTLILNRIEAETNGTASMFGTWWQTLMFVIDVLLVLGIAAFTVFAVLSKKKSAPVTEEKHEENT